MMFGVLYLLVALSPNRALIYEKSHNLGGCANPNSIYTMINLCSKSPYIKNTA